MAWRGSAATQTVQRYDVNWRRWQPSTQVLRRPVPIATAAPPAERGTFPRQDLYRTLQTLNERLGRNPYCNPQASRLPPSPDLKEYLDALHVPESDRCRMSAAFESQQLQESFAQRDHRLTRGPAAPAAAPASSSDGLPSAASILATQAYGSTSTMSAGYAHLNRPERARKHLDRAKQMWWFAAALALKAERTDEFSPEQRMQWWLRAQQLVFQTVRTPPYQQHVAHKKSALWELLMAYWNIRDYEMNPLPPLVSAASGAGAGARPQANLARVAEDVAYVRLMGPFRMEPNRLGLDRATQRIWAATQLPVHLAQVWQSALQTNSESNALRRLLPLAAQTVSALDAAGNTYFDPASSASASAAAGALYGNLVTNASGGPLDCWRYWTRVAPIQYAQRHLVSRDAAADSAAPSSKSAKSAKSAGRGNAVDRKTQPLLPHEHWVGPRPPSIQQLRAQSVSAQQPAVPAALLFGPDTARALTLVHRHMPPPQMPQALLAQVYDASAMSRATLPPPLLPPAFVVAAVPGQVYAGEPWQGHPAVFFPSGRSHTSRADDSKQAAVPWYVVSDTAQPLVGIPDTARGWWDGRVALDQLRNHQGLQVSQQLGRVIPPHA